ncbi:MAG: 16S rRNA (adenine(1518)-N(6)/adenine(1519)-N(6))-dimethyltransferase RsmA [Candidatus Acidiferrales bacterium]
MARQRLGQHFLGNPGWRKRILDTLPLDATEAWIEIGAGHGEMTELLAPRVRRLVAIETDHRLLPWLRERATDEWPNVEIAGGDVLALDLAALAAGERFRVYGNLPYYITTPILKHVFSCASLVRSLHIVIQLEVAERLAAHPGHREYGSLSAFCQFYAKPEIALRVPPGAFQPPPRVKSALVKLTLPGERASLRVGDETRFLEFIHHCFGQKRKTLKNNLRAIAPAEHIEQALAAAHLRLDARAEQLTLQQFAALFAQLA